MLNDSLYGIQKNINKYVLIYVTSQKAIKLLYGENTSNKLMFLMFNQNVFLSVNIC